MAKVKKEKAPSPFAGIKEQKGLKAKIKFFFQVLEEYPTVKQAILFTLFSFICGASQFVLTYGLSLLRYAGGTMADPFPGWKITEEFALFGYDSIAEFIGFLVGSIAGQVLTFVLNRKTTFRINDHIAFRAVAYAIFAVLIIIMQTFLGGIITLSCWRAEPNPSKFIAFLFTLAGLVTGGISALIINFLGNKFFIMREWKKKGEETANADSEVAEIEEIEETPAEEAPVEEKTEE